MTPTTVKERIDSAIDAVTARFPGQIERIRYSIGEDWAGDPALFFRVLVKEPANMPADPWAEEWKRFSEGLLPINWALQAELRDEELQPYCRFRSVSEQQKSRDPKWE